jgi:hypothetical protein
MLLGLDPSGPRWTWSLPSFLPTGAVPSASHVSPFELRHVFDAWAAASSSGSGFRLKITTFVSASALRAGSVRARMT